MQEWFGPLKRRNFLSRVNFFPLIISFSYIWGLIDWSIIFIIVWFFELDKKWFTNLINFRNLDLNKVVLMTIHGNAEAIVKNQFINYIKSILWSNDYITFVPHQDMMWEFYTSSRVWVAVWFYDSALWHHFTFPTRARDRWRSPRGPLQLYIKRPFQWPL